MGKVISKSMCHNCKSDGGDWDNDNQVNYEDGSAFCFACRTATSSTNKTFMNSQNIKVESENDFLEGVAISIVNRGLSENTCKNNNYKRSYLGDKEVEIAEFLDKTGNLVGQKCKTPDKQFFWIRRPKELFMYNLYNEWDYEKPIIITEGEIDALSCCEVGFQAVSLIDGAGSATKDVLRDKEELLKFKEIIIFFDNDEPGMKAFEEIKNIIPIEKLRFVNNYCNKKDANELLLISSLKNVLTDCVVELTPPGIIYGKDINLESLKTKEIKAIPLPWPKLNESMNGLEYGCLYLFLAGTSVGKSSVLREMGYYYRINYPNLKIANLFLEENEEVTPLAYVAIHNNVPLGNLRRDRKLLTDKQWNDSKQLLDSTSMVFINHTFDKSSANILKNIEYLVKVKKFDMIIIDHISYIIGRSGVSKHGERRDVDEFIYALQDLVQKLGCIIIAVSHVSDSQGTKRWDEGEVPNIYSGRSSKVLAQVPDGIIGLSRSMTNELKCDELNLYNLKNRWFSKLGKADILHYINSTGRLQTSDQVFENMEGPHE